MRVVVRFRDDEVFEADSDTVDQDALTFIVRPYSGNNRLVWISMAAVKYLTFPDAPVEDASGADPREVRGFERVVLHFLDGEVVRAYKDESFGQEGNCFNLRLWDVGSGRLVRAIVSLHALKAVFFVKEWDSRAPGEERYGDGAEPVSGPAPRDLWSHRIGRPLARA